MVSIISLLPDEEQKHRPEFQNAERRSLSLWPKVDKTSLRAKSRSSWIEQHTKVYPAQLFNNCVLNR